ncbi:MAG: sialate O-acetylesterase [Akkermansiaceae bacterium]|nr:sialate O-acetylesterase [Akkermansiaceae bacterium]
MKANLLFKSSLFFFAAVAFSHAKEKPVKVFILSGQSNMVGAGKIDGGGTRWGDEMIDPVVSVYEGTYDPKADYDALKPSKTLKLESFGGTKPTPYPGGGVQVTRGFVQLKETGMYEFRPGYGGSSNCLMEVDGKEVHRQQAGGEAVRSEVKLEGGKKVPFKITYFTGDANGLGWTARLDVPGSLKTLVKFGGKYPYLMNDKGQWTARDDVYYRGVVTATGSRWMGVAGGRIGPELGFGHSVGEAIDEPVLVLKTSQGNRSLGWDFLPPGSKQYEYDGKIYAGYQESPLSWDKGSKPEPINWYAGKQYDECFKAAHEVLDNFDAQFPHWKGRGYEIAGFAWWQGDKDRYNLAHAEKYEENLVHLIKTLRREFKAPKAKFIVATLGQTAKDSADVNEKLILDAQLAVDGAAGKYPDFKGNVGTVFTHPLSQGGASNSHYNGNAQTYMDVGLAMGEAMVRLLQGK